MENMIQDLFINTTILSTFLFASGNIFKDRTLNPKSPVNIRLIAGIATGLLGCVLIIYSVRVSPVSRLDFRHIAIILAAIYGGWISSLSSSIVISIFRALYFGISFTSIIGAISVLTVSASCCLISELRINEKSKWIYTHIVCMIILSTSYVITLKDSSFLGMVLLYFLLSSTAATLLIYIFTQYIISIAVLHRKLQEESSKDFLTGLNNVRQYDLIFNRTAENALQRREYLSLLMIDIDFFKNVNDTYGHIEGDAVLKQLGSILVNSNRSFDVVSRNGGEEFTVLLLDCSQSKALEIAEKIRLEVQNHEFKLGKAKRIHITVSIGIASYPERISDINTLRECADEALYISKRTGRNKVTSYKKSSIEIRESFSD